MHILMNMYPSRWPQRSCEWRLNFHLMNLSKQFPDIQFSPVNNLPAIAVGYGIFSMQYLLSHRRLNKWLLVKSHAFHASTTLNWVPQRFVRRSGADLFFGHEYFPVTIMGQLLPTIFDTGMQSDEIIRCARQGYTDEDVQRYRSHNVRMKKFIAARSTLINVREPSGAERFKRLLPEFADKVRTVPPYLPYIEAISEADLVEKQHDSNMINILFVGNAARLKGLPSLVKAIMHLPTKVRTRIRFTVVSQFHDGSVDMLGSGAHVIGSGRQAVWKAVSQNLFSHKIVKQGALTSDEVLALMRASHVFILPTLADTFGFVFLEAMASGCAVVGPERDPQDWILDYGRAGLLVEPCDPGSIAAAIQSLVQDPNLRLSMALAGRQRFLDVYYHRVVAQQYRELFEEAIELWRVKNHPSDRCFNVDVSKQ